MTETPQQQSNRRLLGVGLSFPLRRNASGYIATSSGLPRIKEAIESLIMTDPTERPYRVRNGVPYGTRIRRMLFEDIDTVRALANSDIRRAVATWEPRVNLTDVIVSEQEEDRTHELVAAVIVTGKYKIRATGQTDSHVVEVAKEGRP